jgi:hypothetical protein
MNIQRWPNFFIAGASKAGTTSLYEYLKNIPGIYMSSIKEPSYFTTNSHPENLFLEVIRDKKKYLKLFSNVKDEIAIGEASALYLIDPGAPNLIHNTLPNARIILILRDPVKRAHSHYLHAIRIGSEILSFSEAIKNAYDLQHQNIDSEKTLLIDIGNYSKRIKTYLDVFGKEQVKIIIFEEFIQSPEESIKEILKFLDVPFPGSITIEKIHNSFGIPKNKLTQIILKNTILKKLSVKFLTHNFSNMVAERFLIKKTFKPQLLEKDRLFLQEYYKNDIKNLESILGRDLPWSHD